MRYAVNLRGWWIRVSIISYFTNEGLNYYCITMANEMQNQTTNSRRSYQHVISSLSPFNSITITPALPGFVSLADSDDEVSCLGATPRSSKFEPNDEDDFFLCTPQNKALQLHQTFLNEKGDIDASLDCPSDRSSFSPSSFSLKPRQHNSPTTTQSSFGYGRSFGNISSGQTHRRNIEAKKRKVESALFLGSPRPSHPRRKKIWISYLQPNQQKWPKLWCINSLLDVNILFIWMSASLHQTISINHSVQISI